MAAAALRLLLGCLATLGLLLVVGGAAEEARRLPAGRDFGSGLTLSQATPLGALLARPDRFEARTVLLHGRISDVCQKKGCWTILREGPAHLRVRFRDYGFFLPRDATGSEAFVEGVVDVRTLSKREARHYEAESRDGDPDSVTGPRREVGFIASGVRLVRSD